MTIRLPYRKVYIPYTERTTKHGRSGIQHPTSLYDTSHVLMALTRSEPARTRSEREAIQGEF
jgi:hypothetical protein